MTNQTHQRNLVLALCSTVLLSVYAANPSRADNWPQFRGPAGAGVSTEREFPTQWSDTQNLKWKTPLPGPGSSSPIVWGDRVFVTCYTGYGIERGDGDVAQLKRHLLCIGR
ncbi:MAG: PQQ-binding-like beta-propeller repeat protein [Tepidisphaeraceae bacterium]